MKDFRMLMLDGKIPLNSVIMNNIDLLKNYVNNNHLGELTINIHPSKKKCILTFTSANESTQLAGFQMYINSLMNEIQMDNGMSYFVGNETSLYEMSEFRKMVSNIFPEIVPLINNLTDNPTPQILNDDSNIPTLSSGVESSEATTISNDTIYKCLLDMKVVLSDILSKLDILEKKNLNSEPSSIIPSTQIPEEIKKANIDINAEAATEVATPQEASVPDNVIAEAAKHITETPNPVKIKLDVGSESGEASIGVENVIPQNTVIDQPLSELDEINNFITNLKGKLPELSMANGVEAENIINNYIISNVDSGEVSSLILRLFNEYSFTESIDNAKLTPLDRVTQVRRQLYTNKYI